MVVSLIGSNLPPYLVSDIGLVVFGDYCWAKLFPKFLLERGSKLVSILLRGLIFATVSVLYFLALR